MYLSRFIQVTMVQFLPPFLLYLFLELSVLDIFNIQIKIACSVVFEARRNSDAVSQHIIKNADFSVTMRKIHLEPLP